MLAMVVNSVLGRGTLCGQGAGGHPHAIRGDFRMFRLIEGVHFRLLLGVYASGGQNRREPANNQFLAHSTYQMDHWRTAESVQLTGIIVNFVWACRRTAGAADPPPKSAWRAQFYGCEAGRLSAIRAASARSGAPKRPPRRRSKTRCRYIRDVAPSWADARSHASKRGSCASGEIFLGIVNLRR